MLLFDTDANHPSLRSFRTTHQAPFEGLDTLHLSGSGQFEEADFLRLLKKLAHPKIWLVDLRMEPHGFHEGRAVRWMGPMTENIKSEEDLAKEYGVPYFAFPVLDHFPPSPEIAAEMIAFLNQRPPDVWLHAHCKGGRGRTTTFFAMADMLANHARWNFDEIVTRQHLLGGSNLALKYEAGHPKLESSIQRLGFLKSLYQGLS